MFSDVCTIFHQQPRSIGGSKVRLLSPSYNHWTVPTCPCPPSTCPSSLSQSEPHQQPPSEPEPSSGWCFHQPGRGQPELTDECAGRTCNGGRRGHGARLARLVVLHRKVQRFAYDRVLQLQPKSLSAGDEHPPPHVPVSSVCCFPLWQLSTYTSPTTKLSWTASLNCCGLSDLLEWVALKHSVEEPLSCCISIQSLSQKQRSVYHISHFKHAML